MAYQLKVDGMTEIGEMLNHLLDRVIRGKLENDRDVLLTYVKKKIQ